MDVRGIWLKLFGKKLSKALAEGEPLINYWRDIYTGEPPWKTSVRRGVGGKKTDTRDLLNAGKIVCQELAGLVFAEPPEITADESVKDILEENHFNDNARLWLEEALALGGGALKWIIKDFEFVIDWVRAGDFVPVSYDSRGVSEADFLSSVVNDSKEYRIVEQHRKNGDGYKITREAYESIGDKFIKVPLSLAGLEDKEMLVACKIFEVWKPPVVNAYNSKSPLGMSLFGMAVDLVKQADISFNYLAEELVTSARKIILPASLLQTYFPSAGKGERQLYYDKDEKVYVAFDDAEKESMVPVAIDFDLRIEKITMAINTTLTLLSKACGFSDSMLSFDGVSVKTATEVISENSKTYRMKKNVENSLGYTFISFLNALKEVGPANELKVSALDYYIDWDDSVIEDRNSRANYWNGRIQAGTGRLEDALIELDGLSEDEAVIRAKEIRDSRAVVDIGLWGNE